MWISMTGFLQDTQNTLEKAMAPHSSTLAWKIPWTEEPGGPQSMGSLRVGQASATSLSVFTFIHWRRKWQPTPVFLPGESQGWGSPVGCHLWGRTESDMTDVTQQQQQQNMLSINIVFSFRVPNLLNISLLSRFISGSCLFLLFSVHRKRGLSQLLQGLGLMDFCLNSSWQSLMKCPHVYLCMDDINSQSSQQLRTWT